MYKLTYDSDDNDEINASSTATANQTSKPDLKMKPDVKDAKENPNENSNTKEKRKSVGGNYEGNGRYYSLFANENFLTEDTSRKKKKCCRVGVKSVFLISTVILLIFAIMALMWVVRGMQVEQDSLKLRIAKLEDSSAAALSLLNEPPRQQAAMQTTHHQDPPCCNSNKEQITYLDEVLKGHESRFQNVEEKIQAYRRSGDVRDAQISRNIAQNAADIINVRTKFNTVNREISEAQKVAEAAKSLALFATKGVTLTEDEIDQYLRDLGGSSREGAAFALAHASRRGYITGESADDVVFDYAPDAPPPPIVYDVSSESFPIVTFKENLLEGAGELTSTQPESGTITIDESGRYFLSVGFCVHSHKETTVQILRNGIALREFTVAGNNLGGIEPSAVEISFNPPPGFEYAMDENVMPTPPMPPGVSSDASTPVVRPYQFDDVINLDVGDELQMRISKGTLAEYTFTPDTRAAKSCTRFLGFRL